MCYTTYALLRNLVTRHAQHMHLNYTRFKLKYAKAFAYLAI